jgi:hypothetical protein
MPYFLKKKNVRLKTYILKLGFGPKSKSFGSLSEYFISYSAIFFDEFKLFFFWSGNILFLYKKRWFSIYIFVFFSSLLTEKKFPVTYIKKYQNPSIRYNNTEPYCVNRKKLFFGSCSFYGQRTHRTKRTIFTDNDCPPDYFFVRQNNILSVKTTYCPQKQPLVRQNFNVNIKTEIVEDIV